MKICKDCGDRFGHRRKNNLAISWWVDTCDWCDRKTIVTSDRDYGYPSPPSNIVEKLWERISKNEGG